MKISSFRKSLGTFMKPAIALLLGVVLTLAAPVGAFAAENSEMPDPSRSGPISVTFKNPENGKPIGGENVFALYKAADVVVDNGFRFVFRDKFAEAGDSLNEDSDLSAELASKLAKLADSRGISPVASSAKPDGSGVMSFDGLEVGLYLVVQTGTGKGDEAYTIDPFLVTIPLKGTDGALIYDVDATPKVGIKPNEKPPKKTPPPKHPPKLPQTGQLWWPVFVGTAAGVLLLVFGIMNKKRGGNN